MRWEMTAVGDGGGWEMSSGTQAGRLMEVSGTRIGMYVGDGARVPRVGLGFKSEALGGGTVGCGWLAATGQAHPTGGWLWGAAWRAKGRLPLRVSAGQHCRAGGRVDAYRQMDAARGVVVRALFAKSSLSGGCVALAGVSGGPGDGVALATAVVDRPITGIQPPVVWGDPVRRLRTMERHKRRRLWPRRLPPPTDTATCSTAVLASHP